MATVNKDFKIKYGLVVEGSAGTINGYNILTKSTDDQNYIIGLIGGSATPNPTPDTVVLRDSNADFSANMITADLTGDVTGTVSDISNHDTGDLAEGTNLYFTAERVQDEIGTAVTNGSGSSSGGSLTYNDGSDALYVTVTDQFPTHSTSDLSEGTNLYYTDARVTTHVQTNLTTDDLSEGSSNKYHTDARVRDALDNGDGISYNSATGVFSAHLGNGLEIDGSGAIQIDDTVVATETDLTNAITSHNASSGVHGVTGDVVGTTDTQTLSNKTLGSDLAAGGFQITGLGVPNNASDAATKEYVDAVSEGLHIHEAAVAATTGNISISNDLMVGDQIDGVTLAATNRVLVKNQSTASENGIYVVQSSGAAIRAADFDQPNEVDGGDFIFVTGGNTNDNTGWVQTATGVVTIGTDPIYFTQFSGAGTYLAGNGLTLDGNTFEIDDSITATLTYVGTEIGSHASDTSTHGVTGNIVGTTDSQTLENKTLGSGTVLGANLDASNYHITNLDDPTSNQDAATKFYVDGEVSTVAGDLSTHEGATTGVHGVTGSVVGTSDSQTLTNKTIDGSSNTISNIANASLVNDSITINGSSTALGSSITLGTDDVAEGTTNKYFTDNRAKDAAGYILENATKTNIQITYDEGTHTLAVTAENGVADSDTDDLAEGTTNLYFTNQRAVDALEAVVPNFTAIEVNSVAKQVAAESAVATASTVTAYSWAKADYRSAKFMVKFAAGSHTEVSEILVTLDTSDNVSITEYAIVGTNGSLGDVTADVSGSDVRVRVTTVNNNTNVMVVGTLLK